MKLLKFFVMLLLLSSVSCASAQDSLHVARVGFFETPGPVWSVAVAGNSAYVADQFGGLRVINITNPASPIEVGFYNTPGEASSVALAGNYAYVADWASGLRVINITNPLAPTEAGFYDAPGYASSVAVAGNYAYVGYFSAGLVIYDISFFAPCPVPAAPDSLIIQYLPQTEDFLLHWEPVVQDTAGLPIEVDYYVVLRGNSTDVLDSLGVPVPPDTTVFIDSTAFDAGARFFYQVKAVKN